MSGVVLPDQYVGHVVHASNDLPSFMLLSIF